MTELLPIPADDKRVNAKRLLRLRRDALIANGANVHTLNEAGVNQNNSRSVEDIQFALKFPQNRPINGIDQFIGMFDRVDNGKKLVAAAEVKPFDIKDLDRYLSPLEKLSLRLSDTYRSEILHDNSIGIFALVAEPVTTSSRPQTDMLSGLLRHVTERRVDIPGSTYIALAPTDPAREVVEGDGFEPINDRSAKYLGVPLTLFARHTT